MTGSGIGSAPIRPEAPAGEDVRDQEVFLDLQAEVNRSQSVSSGSSAVVDWNRVSQMATAILTGKSKDLLVAAYLSVAMARTEGTTGVVEGLAVMNGMVKEHWDALFPPIGRLRARRNALSWWLDQMQEILPTLSGPPLSPEDFERGGLELRELNAILGEKDPDAPTLSPLYGLLEALPVSLPEAPPETKPVAQIAEPSPSESPAGMRFPVPGEGDPAEILEQISPVLLDLAERLSDADPGDSRSIYLSRMVLWEGIQEIPENDNTRTRIPPPAPHLLSTLETLTVSGAEEDRLHFLLSHQTESPFWFELSYLAGAILEARGAGGAGGAEALRGTLRSLCARLPGIERLSFAGGEIAFLSEEGRSWLFPKVSGKEEAQSDGGSGWALSLLAPVRAAISEGRLSDACDRFEEIRRKEPTIRGRFLLNLELLSAVERMGRDFPVISLALVLLEDLERVRLDLWEPGLAARALPLIAGVLASSPDETYRRKAENLSARLATFDIPGALRVHLGGR